ncbi:MAG: sodium-translocating pyrophosphatase [Bacteroidaceae bacterium]|nr:sodium-translocating pyrophosphatase [Bacteroidaceae bacterium]
MNWSLFSLVPIASLIALGFALYFFRKMKAADEGTPEMVRIALAVRQGANSYLRQQYKVVGYVFLVVFVIFAFMAYVLHIQNYWVPVAFLTGGFFSGLAGYLGMKTATYASARTANAARQSMDAGLRIAFRSGAVMGLVVVGFGLLDISLWFVILNKFDSSGLISITTTMLTFGMGASMQALFARVGGGIYTKAADVGADIVGKVEADIPEDDPRNPATIADNVGDNVGDVAGMGADLYESYCGSILSTAALGAVAFAASGMQFKAVIAPMLIAAVGVFLSLLGIFLVRTKEGATMKDLLHSLGIGTNVSAVLIAVVTFGILYVLGLENWLGLSFSVITGLAAGVIIGQATEYYTSHTYRPTQAIAEASQTGSATVIIKGIGTGMISTCIPVVTISVAILLSYLCAIRFDISGMMEAHNIQLGLYGIGIAAVGMLSTLGITLATDAYGPIADNAGGNAEMSRLEPYVRQRTDALDALGNTTAATGKGFAIGSAALTALALLASYIEEIKIAMQRALDHGREAFAYVDGRLFDPSTATMPEFMDYFQVNLMNPKVLIGVFLGAMAAFLFCGLTMGAVGRAAQSMVEEVRRQFQTIAGILEGKATPDYKRCVEISTRAAQREMVVPSLLAIVIPIVVGVILGVAGVLGLLVGGLAAGFTLAVFMSNSGGAWDNAKKMVEEGNFGGKGSASHKATIVGDTVGDPFKDTSGPSLNILIKLMSMISIVMAGLIVSCHLF